MIKLLKELQALEIPLTGEAQDAAGNKYNHVEFGPLMDAINPVLQKHNAYIVQPMGISEGERTNQMFLTQLYIDDKVALQSSTLVPYKTDARQVAAQYSILKKYAIIGMLGLKVEEKEPPSTKQPLPEADLEQILKLIEEGQSPAELIIKAEKFNLVSPEQQQKILKHGSK